MLDFEKMLSQWEDEALEDLAYVEPSLETFIHYRNVSESYLHITQEHPSFSKLGLCAYLEVKSQLGYGAYDIWTLMGRQRGSVAWEWDLDAPHIPGHTHERRQMVLKLVEELDEMIAAVRLNKKSLNSENFCATMSTSTT